MPGECFTAEQQAAASTAKYRFVAVDIDTTGKRLIDEIIQLSAYTPDKPPLDQYIMPYNNLNQAAKMKHQLRVINLGIFRMLKNMHTHKVIKTKSEYAALKDFLDWLDELKASDADDTDAEVPSKGIVLIFHEQRQFIPCMLLSALKRYDLLDRFTSTIVGFGNNYWLAERKCCQPFKYLSLTQLAKMFLQMTDEEEKTLFEGNASVRAKLAYDIFHYLLSQPMSDANGNEVESILDKMDLLSLDTGTVSSAASDDGGDSCTSTTGSCSGAGGTTKAEELKKMRAALAAGGSSGHGHSVLMNVEEGLHVLSEQQDVIKRQNSLRPLFVNYFRGKIYHRLLAVDCRRSLAEHGFDIEKLQEVWTEKKVEGITELIEELDLGEKKEELVKIIDAHFDPEKSPMKPVRNQQNNHGNRRDFRSRKNFRPSTSMSSAIEVKNQ